MGEKAGQTVQTLERFKSMRYVLIFEGVLVGIFAGVVAVFYRYLLSIADTMLFAVLSFCRGRTFYMLLWFTALILMAMLVQRLNRWEPLISGSGIPQVEAELAGQLKPCWWRILLAKIAGGFLCLLGGLSLGREGPSIQLGAMAGKGLSRIMGRFRVEERFLITCGASAGLSAAFNAPLAGVIFALEEVHKNFSALVMVSAMAASITSDFISTYIFGMSPVFHFTVNNMIPLNAYGFVIILGVLCGLFGALYNKTLLVVQDFYDKIKRGKIIIPFVLAGVLGFTVPEVLGGGHHMIQSLAAGGMLIKTIILLLVVKFLFSMVSFGSGAPGGIFFPLLVLGAYIGGAFGSAAAQWIGVDTALIANFIILAMAGYFSAIVRAPITGIILISEMTGSFSHLLSLSVVSVTAYIVAEALKSDPVYDSLLERLLKKRGIETKADTGSKMILEAGVDQGSQAANKRVCDLKLPEGCLLVAVRGQKGEIIPRGGTLVRPGDTLIALADEKDTAAVQSALNRMTTL